VSENWLAPLHITNLNLHDMNIHHSGILGLNTFGVSSIQQLVFANNMLNFVLMFLDSNSQIPVVLPSTDSILTQAQLKFGSTDTPLMFAAGGLNVQTTYDVATLPF